jgi:hypothetical protein
MNARQMWNEARVERKQGLQRLVVLAGLEWDGERSGTVTSGWFYSRLQRPRLGGDRASVGPVVVWRPRAQKLRELAGVAAVRLDSLSRPARDQRRSHHDARHAHRP